MKTLTGRTVMLTCLVALISVIFTAVVAWPLAARSATAEARAALAGKAKVAAEAIEGRTILAEAREQQRINRIATALRNQGVETVAIRNGKPDKTGLPDRVVTQVSGGTEFSGQGMFDGRLMMIEGRPAGTKSGIVLLEPLAPNLGGQLLRRLWLALAAGLGAGVIAGYLLSRRLVRPMRGAAVAARRLSAGDRTVRLPETGAPTEVADLSHALNELTSALAASEGRQRQFLMSISHELRTPLTTLKGYAEALKDGVVGPDGAARAGETMLAEAEHLDRLVADLLVLARLEADDFPLDVVPVDLSQLMTDAAEAWGARYATAGVPLLTEIPPGQVFVHTDPGRIRQVLDGLLENALRVVPPGAEVKVVVGPGFFEVRDGGPGLADADLAVAFDQGELFRRYQGVRKVGTGLGLALAARLVRRLGGTITAGHAPEGGARFTVSLPY